MNAFLAIVRRDLLLAARRKSEVLTALFFFMIVVSLFPLGIGPETAMLRRIAPGVLWVAALLAAMLSLGRLFAADHQDGTLEQMALSPTPLALLVSGKVLAHWLTSGLPLVLLAPVLGLQFDLSAQALGVLMISLLLGTPILSLIGGIGAALVLGARRGGVLLSLLILPLYIPVLVFGVSAVDAAVMDFGFRAQLLILGAMLLGALALCPWAAAAALRQAVD